MSHFTFSVNQVCYIISFRSCLYWKNNPAGAEFYYRAIRSFSTLYQEKNDAKYRVLLRVNYPGISSYFVPDIISLKPHFRNNIINIL
jgi:hypothetical protein